MAFTRELATLLESGIPLHSSLKILQERVESPLFKEALGQITVDIEAGGSLSQAIARHPTIFPPMYHRLITVGEETGRLQIALRQIGTHLEKQAALGEKVRKALGYPAFVSVIGVVAGYLLLSFSLPAMTGLFKEFGAQLPLTTRILLAISHFMERFGMEALGVAALTAVALAVYFRSQRGAPIWDRLMLNLPLVGKVVRQTNMFRFTSTVQTLLAAGLPLTEALEITARATANSQVREAILRLRQDVTAGQSLSQALSQQDIFPNLIRQMVVVGEESGALHQNLESLSSFFEQEADRGVASLTGKIEPMMILLVGGMVGFIAIAVMSTLYGIMKQIR